MSSFLHLLAQDLIRKFPVHPEQITVIFPNKRAGLFLAEELSRLAATPYWMPDIVTLDEYMERCTGLQTPEDLILIIKLFKAYIKASGSEERFEDFYFWGHMLLEDFDDIDKHLVEAQALFHNLVSLKELEFNFPYLSEQQIETIKNFWNSFNPDKYSKEQREFLKVWDKLYATYRDFKSALLQEKLCFNGMGQRYFLEHIEEYRTENYLVFAGFNALTACEKQIFRFYQNQQKALFYWDYDIYYTSNSFHEAGNFIRENLKNFPNELGPEHFNNFLHNGKQIEFISVPSSIGQAKLIPELIRDFPDRNNYNTAIVLCDERMLIPVTHSIPDDIRKINITIGYPAQTTSVAALISLLGDLMKYVKTEKDIPYYYYKPVIALLNHKLIKDTDPEAINRITQEIQQRNTVYISGKELQFNEVVQAVFSSEKEHIPDYLLRILRLLNGSFGTETELLYPIEKEFIFRISLYIQSLQNTFREEQIEPEDKLYMQIISKMVNTLSIPFSGEPLEGLQLMGLLETRLLDFKNLIVLSANENILPPNRSFSSFIPYNLRTGFKLPSPEYQDSLYAYYFYRLLQRAKHVRILYSSAVKGLNTGEMSRFLYQIKYESGLPIRENHFQNRISLQEVPPIAIEKNQYIREKLEKYTCSEENALSPSALNTYMDCPVKFYFKYLADIREKDEIAEELDHRLLGNIFHECSQSLYATVAQEEITAPVIDSLLRNRNLIDEHIRKSYLKLYDQNVNQLMDNGSNELILGIIRKYILQMLTYDKKMCPFRIISMEKKYYVPLSLRIDNRPKTVFIGGIIDRIDQTKEAVRIIDYKTGADNTLFKNIPSVFDVRNSTRNKAAFQTLLYCLMFRHTYRGNQALIPGIYSTKLLFGKDYNYRLKCDKEYILDFESYKDEFLEYLSRLVEEIFADHTTFTQTLQEKKCRTCNYSAICNK